MATAIRVVLKEDVDTLGSSGEVVRVRPGYARNFLIPRGLAVPATRGNLARVEELKRQAAARAAQELSAARELAQKLEGASVRIERAVGEEGKMYGSVTPRDLEDVFRAQGIELDRKKLQLGEPIKQLGVSEIVVKLARGTSATIRVEVVKKSS
jgi:large subunit ribosomal protein L9